MGIQRLEELKDMFENARTYNDMHWLSPVTEDDVLELIDEAIARQSVTDEQIDRLVECVVDLMKTLYPLIEDVLKTVKHYFDDIEEVEE